MLIALAVLSVTILAAVALINAHMIMSAADRTYDFLNSDKERDGFDSETLAAIRGFNADCIIVLGARVNGSTPSLMLKDRIIVGSALYNSGVCTRLLMSGDSRENSYSEVDVMKDYAIEEMGADSSGIEEDRLGLSTYESLIRARDLYGCRKVIIVSQGFHLPRAIYIAEHSGMEALGINAAIGEYSQTKSRVREIAARVKDFIKTALN